MTIQEFTLRFRGDAVKPASVSLQQLADLMHSMEKVVEGYLAEDDFAEDIAFDEVDREASLETQLSLVRIMHESASYTFAVPEVYVPAMKRLVASVRSQDYSDMPLGSYKALHRIAAFAKAKRAALDVSYQFDGERQSALISPSTTLPEPNVPKLRGSTVLVGECIRVGGSRERGRLPKAYIRPLSDKRSGVVVTIPLHREHLLAVLAAQLYQNVKVSGLATWRADSRKVIAFEARTVEPYTRGTAVTAFKKLADIAAEHWHATDALEYVQKLREE